MREVEIERLLQWAYRDELPKRGVGDVATSWDGMNLYRELLTVVDDDPGFPVIMGPPHADALTIERAVQGLHAEVALDWLSYRELLFGDVPMLAPATDPTAIMRSDHSIAPRVFNEVELVESCARLNRRPQWDVGLLRPRRMIGANGKPVIVGQCKDTLRYTLGSHCPLRYAEPSIEKVAAHRAEYLVWRGALQRLVGTLRGWLLRAHVPLDPIAPALPWLDARASERGAPAPVAIASAFKTWADEGQHKRPRQRRSRDNVPAAS